MTYIPSATEVITESAAHDVVTDETRQDEMAAVYDAMTGSEAQEEQFKAQPPLPPYRGERQPSFDDTMNRVADWLHTPLEERQSEAQTHRTVDQLKADAAKYGLSLTEAGMLESKARQAPPEWQSLNDRISASAPNAKPHETVSRLVDVAEFMDRDPVQGLQWVAQQYGLRITALDRVG